MKKSMTAMTVVLVGVLLFALRDFYPLSEHDEPVVVDNGPIRITRQGAKPAPEDSDTKKWEIHHSGPLKELRAWSWSKGQSHPAEPISLSFVGNIVFETINPGSPANRSSFRLRRDPFWELQIPQKVRLRSDFDFIHENGELKPMDANYEMHRILSVKAGATTICFRESATPGPPALGGNCQNMFDPDSVKIELCVDVKTKCPTPK